MKKLSIFLAVLLGGFMFSGCENKGGNGNSLWDFNTLSTVEVTTTETGYYYNGNENIKGIYFEGAEYNGIPTNVFAFVGIPVTEKPENGYPAMVLVHGGLGQAFGDWVKLWTDRGYAAIALSVDANITDANGNKTENPEGGPNISLNAADMRDPENSWEYISVENIIRCHNILRSMDEIDKNNIGITGISWGSFLTCAALGADTRFKFGIPVYGAGYNHEDISSGIADSFTFDDENAEIYVSSFDPSAYMKFCAAPILWICGANDFAFSIACNQKCADGNKSINAYSWRANLTHGQEQGNGSTLPEIFRFVDYVVKGNDDFLIRVSEGEINDGVITVNVLNSVAVDSAKLYWSNHPLEFWHEGTNVWIEEEVDVNGGAIIAQVPDGGVYGFIEIVDGNGNKISSRLFSF